MTKNDKRYKHGMTGTLIFSSWQGMLARCYNENATQYARYGGRGIGVCDRWLEFVNFYEDMGDRPEGMTLDRIDNDGDYSPDNCRWASYGQQANNTRAVKRYEFDGRMRTITELLEYTDVSRNTLRARLANGWPIEQALVYPAKKGNNKTLRDCYPWECDE